MTAEPESSTFSIARAVALVSFWTVVWLGVGVALGSTMLVGFELVGSPLKMLKGIAVAVVFVVWAVFGVGFGSYLFAAAGGLDLPWSRLRCKVFQLLTGLLIGGGAGLAVWLILAGRVASSAECRDPPAPVRPSRTAR
jgi:hypothetical protein